MTVLPMARRSVLLPALPSGELSAAPLDWPAFGPARSGLYLNGHRHAVPDVVGPVDGTVRLTVFTEGTH